ncbi:MAG: 4Fe-4S dicluster domain-containing protein [Actinobacteria bacterium]|nr:MAG: 4Fe-4S dicluster domain-containing protein [Actinomycetota bacterium]
MAYKITTDCTGCGICEEQCPHGAISESSELFDIDSEICNNCGDCQEICPQEAIVSR